jgi:ribosome recycling factor
MHPFLVAKKPAFDAVLDHLAKELGTLRTGRANPAILEGINVVAYDSIMHLKSVASISVPDSRTLAIQPWDKSLLQPIEKAIRDADIGVNPTVDGETVRLNMPQMTEENRKKLVKMMGERIEDAKISLRKVREEARAQVLKFEADKQMGEDEKYKAYEELDKMTKEYGEKIDTMADKKEEEIMTI